MRMLEVATSVSCPIACPYCPQKVIVGAYGDKVRQLSWEVFIKALDQITPEVGVTFSTIAEPFLHPRIMEMLRETARRGHWIAFNTTMLGATVEVAKELRQLPLHITVHVPDNEGKMHLSVTPSYLAALKEMTGLRWMCFGLPHPEVAKLGNPVEENALVMSRSSTLFRIAPRKGPLACQRQLIQNEMMPNGDVYICCHDWGLKHKIGNILEQSFNDMEPERVRMREAMRDHPETTICPGCEESMSI